MRNTEKTAPMPRARGFAALCITYFLSVFTNNFFKQSVMLLAIAAGREQLQVWATVLIYLPFLLLAAPAGFFADRFAKRTVVVWCKILELAAMLIAAFAIMTMNWSLILIVLAVEGIQSALFSPAINGTIPAIFAPELVTKANAIVRMVSTGGILAGVAVAGFALDIPGLIARLPANRLTIAVAVVILMLLAIIASLKLPRFAAVSPDLKFPITGPLDTLKTLAAIRRDYLLGIAIIAQAAFYFIGMLNILVINQLGIMQFKLSPSLTSVLILAQLLGIAGGGLIAARLAKGPRWYKVLVPAAILLAFCMLATGSAPRLDTFLSSVLADYPLLTKFLVDSYLVVVLGLMGIGGGIYMVPLDAFIQVRPAADKKGQIIAASNFTCFSGVLISGPVLWVYNHFTVAPTNIFASIGIFILIASIFLKLALNHHDRMNNS